MKANKKNLLLEEFDEAPFSGIDVEDIEEALHHYIKQTRDEIAAITEQSQPPTFENTIEALEFSGQGLERVAQLFFNLNSAETTLEIQELAQKISPELSKLNNDITLNKALFERVSGVYEKQDALNLDTEQRRLLEMHYLSFTRNGANLSEKDQKKIRSIYQELAQLSLTFGEHVLAEMNDFELFIEAKERLNGLPDGVVRSARKKAQDKGKDGYLLTLDFPTYLPVMKYAEDRDIRKQMALAFSSRGFKDNENNNEAIVLRISKLRHQRAQLLGYEHHAEYVLERRMAHELSKVQKFLDELLDKAMPVAGEQLQEVAELALEKDGIQQLQKWDLHFYSEQLKKQRFSLDEQKVKAYFELNKVVHGMFGIANELYGLKFKENKKADRYHEEVIVYDVFDEGDQFQALFKRTLWAKVQGK